MWFYAIAMPSTTLLFFFRVRAVYLDNKYIVGAFAVLWLGVLAASINSTVALASATRIEPTNYCLPAIVSGSRISASAIIPFVNDVLGFFAVTWRLAKNSQVDPTLKTNVKTMIFGHYLPRFSRALLQNGQIYFL